MNKADIYTQMLDDKQDMEIENETECPMCGEFEDKGVIDSLGSCLNCDKLRLEEREE